MPQLYSRVFLQILDSSLANDWKARYVFEDFLKLANEDGVVDMTREAIARRTNVPLDVVTHGIQVLEAPDPGSRDPSESGRRLIRLDDHRDWGWRVVNWARYDAIRSNAEHREAKAREMKRYRAKKSTEPKPSPPHTPPRAEQDSSPSPSPSPEDPLHVGYTSTTCSLHPPPGFPRNEIEAGEVGDSVGCPRDFASQTWLLAKSRGWEDHARVPVRDFSAYLAICWKYQKNRDPEAAAGRANKLGQAAPSAFTLKSQLQALDEEIKVIHQRGHEDAFGWTPKNPEDRAKIIELKKKRKAVNAKLAEVT